MGYLFQYQARAEPLEPSLFTATNLDQWYAPLSEPVRSKPKPRAQFEFAVTEPTLFVATTLDEWFRETSQPLFARAPLRKQYAESITEPSLFTATTLDQWYQPTSEPVRARARLRPQFEFAIVESSIAGSSPLPLLPNDWDVPQSQPVRRRPWYRHLLEPLLSWRSSSEPSEPGASTPTEYSPAMRDKTILLFADVVESLRAFAQGLGQSADQDDARLAATKAFDKIMKEREWKYLLQLGQITTVAPVTGTLLYVNSLTGVITGATNATPIVITCSNHGLVDDQVVTVAGVLGNTAANGTFRVNVLTSSTFELTSSVGNGSYTSGGRWTAKRQAKLVSGGDGGEWPSWAVHGYLRIGNDDFRAVRGGNEAVLLLDEYQNPGEDLASGTSFTLYRSTYTLPHDFASLGQVEPASFLGGAEYLTPQRWLAMQRNVSQSSTPYSYTVMGDPLERGQMAIFLYPYPDDAAAAQFIYHRLARRLRRTGYATAEYSGTITVESSDPTLVTGTSTAFTNDMIGSWIRVSKSTTELPTATWGQNPYTEQRQIVAVRGTNVAVVERDFDDDYSGVKYRISDPVDLHPVFHPLMLAGCELELMRMRVRNPKETHIYEAAYAETLMKALESDKMTFHQEGVWSGAGRGIHGWHNTPPSDLYS